LQHDLQPINTFAVNADIDSSIPATPLFQAQYGGFFISIINKGKSAGGLMTKSELNVLNSDYYSQNFEGGLKMHSWQIQQAKAKLSEVIKCAESEGPQGITLHGQPVAVVMTRALYDQLTGNALSFVEFMRESPLFGLEDVNFDRDHSLTREVSI
jgi:prevent-host-death family protein